MFKKTIAIVDIETTGGSSKNSKIIEIAVLRVENGEIVKHFTSLVNPGTYIPEFITNITGIKNQDIENAPHFEDIAAELDNIFKDAIFMAHHVVFDFSFVKRQMEACGYSFKSKLLCSVKLSRTLYPANRGHSLEKLIDRHNIQVLNRHRAYDDALAVYEFTKIAAEEHGVTLFDQALNKQLKLKSLPSNFDESQLSGVTNVPGVYIFKNSDNVPVYIGKSIQLRNRILSHFTQSTSVSKELKISQNTHKLEIIETPNELEALLLESKLIKDLLPVYNRKLRRKKEQTILSRVRNEAGYYEIKLIESNVAEFANPDDIFGVYDKRMKAKVALQNARKTFDLCSNLLGLEKSKGACFYYQLGKCKGACINSENNELYNSRLNLAFERSRVATWKYKLPIIIPLDKDSGFVVDQWRVIARIRQYEGSEPEIEALNSSFDLDNYKILNSYIAKNKTKIRLLPSNFAI